MSATPAAQPRRWTLEEVHALPEDGNRYEFVYGELWVSPAPTDRHETILAELSAVLQPYVGAQSLGLVFHPRSVFRVRRDLELEPDLTVRQRHPDPNGTWETAPLPSLVVEVVSPSTRARDYGRKRLLYMEHGIPEYWIVDDGPRTITVVRPDRDPDVVHDVLRWHPAGTREPLTFALTRVFG